MRSSALSSCALRAIRSPRSIRRLRSIKGDEPVTASTALLLCIRNELPDRVIRNLEPMLAGIAASGYADRFHIYVLSDTSDATVAAAEDRAIRRARARHGAEKSR